MNRISTLPSRNPGPKQCPGPDSEDVGWCKIISGSIIVMGLGTILVMLILWGTTGSFETWMLCGVIVGCALVLVGLGFIRCIIKIMRKARAMDSKAAEQDDNVRLEP